MRSGTLITYAGALLTGLVLAPPAAAATIAVTTFVDEAGTGGACSLREAIRSANSGNDRLPGEGDKDRLDGGGGSDRLSGGPGADVCQGGPGKDRQTSCSKREDIP